jgi:crotonobetainyl-CoA:carnitine CoA-transferase CaiB-like acyl-CoA transferase
MATFCAARNRGDALKVLLGKGIAAAPCLDGNDLLRDVALHGVTLVRDETGGLVKGLPYRLDGKGLAIERSAPDLGQHTEEVLRELLGYDDACLKQLNDSGVTSTTPTIGEV